MLTARSQGFTEPLHRVVSNESFAVLSTAPSPSPVLLASSPPHGSEESLASVTAGGKIVLGDSGDEKDGKSSMVRQFESLGFSAITHRNLHLYSCVWSCISAVLQEASGKHPRAMSPPISAPARPAVSESSSAEPSPSPSVNPALLRVHRSSGQFPRPSPRRSDSGGNGGDQQLCEVLELAVRPGRYHMVPVLVESPGLQLSWQFQTEPKVSGQPYRMDVAMVAESIVVGIVSPPYFHPVSHLQLAHLLKTVLEMTKKKLPTGDIGLERKRSYIVGCAFKKIIQCNLGRRCLVS